ncbi:MAG: NAD+ synthase [candidate division Zixibacteria bacterium]|nr:NAD+ synthase [candidate division Zixibacteria bacterium]
MIRFALAQINPTVGDFAGNFDKIISFVKLAHRQKADLILFPELALCGYPPEDLLLNQRFLDANRRYLKKIAAVADKINIICGYASARGEAVFNSAAVLSDRQVTLVYDKIALPDYGAFNEKRYFQPGNRIPLVRIGDTAIGIGIGEDIQASHAKADLLAGLGNRLLVNLCSSPYHLHKTKERIRLLQRKAKASRCYVAYVNTVGAQDELVFAGGSLVIDFNGKVIARAQQFVEELLIVDLPCYRQKNGGPAIQVGGGVLLGDELYAVEQVELKLTRRRKKRRPIRRQVIRRLPEPEEIYQVLVLGTGDYIRKNGFTKALLGLSGGVDSALAAAVAVDALGHTNVEALFMPSEFTLAISRQAAAKQAKLLKIKLYEMSIDNLYAAYRHDLGPFFRNLPEDTTEENIQARIRGNLLMAFSNKFGHLVLNTGNKSEAAVGYCTLYGDMVGGFAVLKDIPKTMVYKICRYLNRSRKREIIAREIIIRPPSAELRKDQLDSDALPPYDILDKILQAFIEENKPVAEIIKAGFDRKVVERVVRMVMASEHKRRQAPPGVRITPCTFDQEHHWPITNQF